MLMEFAVQVIGEDEKKGYWVLMADMEQDRFLIAQDGGVFHWVDIARCLLVKAINPEAPKPRLMIQARPEPNIPLSIPSLDGRKLKGGNFHNG